MKNMDWLEEAACRGISSPDIFYPTSQGPAAKLDAQSAIAICRDCAVIVQCEEFARKYSRNEGVWAGKLRTPRQRPPVDIEHGTEAGARLHYRRGESPCGECRRAANLADSLRKERRRA